MLNAVTSGENPQPTPNSTSLPTPIPQLPTANLDTIPRELIRPIVEKVYRSTFPPCWQCDMQALFDTNFALHSFAQVTRARHRWRAIQQDIIYGQLRALASISADWKAEADLLVANHPQVWNRYMTSRRGRGRRSPIHKFCPHPAGSPQCVCLCCIRCHDNALPPWVGQYQQLSDHPQEPIINQNKLREKLREMCR